jgi:hypothetical protein
MVASPVWAVVTVFIPGSSGSWPARPESDGRGTEGGRSWRQSAPRLIRTAGRLIRCLCCAHKGVADIHPGHIWRWPGVGGYCYPLPTPNVQLREQMDSAGLSDERAARSFATLKSSGARDGRTRRSRRSMVSSEPVRGSQGNSTSSLTVSLPVGDADSSIAAPAMADHRQADYFLRLLAQSRRLSEHRIDLYHKAIAAFEANGDAEGAASFRRMVCSEEQDRQTLDGLIENLHRRFASGAPSEVPSIPRTVRVAAH